MIGNQSKFSFQYWTLSLSILIVKLLKSFFYDVIWFISQQLSNTAKSPRTSKMPLDVPLVEINRQSMVPSVLSEITHKEAVYANAEMYAAQMLPSAFEGEDEWSIRATLQGFNRDRSRLSFIVWLQLFVRNLNYIQFNIISDSSLTSENLGPEIIGHRDQDFWYLYTFETTRKMH